LFDREKQSSTGFQKGIAIPHCRLDNLSEFIMGMLVIPEGMDFNAMDGKDTKIFVFIIGPSGNNNNKTYIRYLSTISTALNSMDTVNAVLSQSDPQAVRDIILRHADSSGSSEKEQNEKSLFQVVVQHANKFNDILELFTELEHSKVWVIEANNADKYLRGLPLYSTFWNEQPKSFNKIVTAVINKSCTDEIKQKINSMIDEMEHKSGILVIVQDINYINGTLDI